MLNSVEWMLRNPSSVFATIAKLHRLKKGFLVIRKLLNGPDVIVLATLVPRYEIDALDGVRTRMNPVARVPLSEV